jgi:sulfatase maturation enzyme AslB (radical SAM superfamily)
MSEDTAKRSIDWLHGTGCRVFAYMGGEPLLRPDFIHKITYHAAKKNFWIYLPTNARLCGPTSSTSWRMQACPRSTSPSMPST